MKISPSTRVLIIDDETGKLLKSYFIKEDEAIPEPELWFHDILRQDGTAFSNEEISFIKSITSNKELK